MCSKEDNLVAIASDVYLNIGVPCLDINDAKGLVDLIEKEFLSKKVSDD